MPAIRSTSTTKIKEETTAPGKQVADAIVHEKTKYIWLWIGVSIFTLAILFIWGFNTKLFIEDTAFGTTDKPDLLQRGKQDLEKTIRLINESDNTGALIQAQNTLEEKNRQKSQPTPETNEETNKQLQNSILLLLQNTKGESTTTSTTTTP